MTNERFQIFNSSKINNSKFFFWFESVVESLRYPEYLYAKSVIIWNATHAFLT